MNCAPTLTSGELGSRKSAVKKTEKLRFAFNFLVKRLEFTDKQAIGSRVVTGESRWEQEIDTNAGTGTGWPL